MPKKLYICVICGAEAPTEKAAAECEAKHKKPVSVDKPIYNRKDKKSNYPESVLVHFADGTSAPYYRRPY